MSKLYQWCPIQKKVVPKDEVLHEFRGHHVIDDTMPLTKSPINGKLYFDSKSALRAHYKQNGMEEVGTSYEKEVDPWDLQTRDTERETDKKIKQHLIDKYYGRR